MRINPKALLIDSGIGEDIATMLEQAISQHTDTGRGAAVTLKITVKADKESGKSKAKGRVIASLPDGDDDMVVKKLPSVGLLTIAADHPGQQTLDDLTTDEPTAHTDDPLSPEVVVARLNLAIAGTGKTCSAYAKKHGLPHLALTKLLATGMVGDAASYGPIYDHALTLVDDAEPEAQDNKSKAAG
jgi:hypothetical protein